MDINLDAKEVLILVGPQACGKSTLAIKLAEEVGTYEVTDDRFLTNKLMQGGILAKEHDTIIIEEFEPTPEKFDTLKQLISDDLLRVERKHQAPKHVEAPRNIILCTGDANVLKIPNDARRFFVLEMPAAK